jgi:predicted ATPase/class 3 adenylate cyclase
MMDGARSPAILHPFIWRTRALHHLVPQFIIDNYRQDKRHGRFFAVCLFADVSGFSTITDNLMKHGPHGAETLAVLMRNVFDPLISSVYEHQGFVPSLAGDAITAVFPAAGDSGPAQEELAARAMASAWQIQQQMKAAALQHTPYGNFQVSAKVGAACGPVNWGIVTSEDGRRATYYFEGPAIDGSAQAEHAAAAGEIICTAALHDLAGALVTAETLAGDGDLYRLLALSQDAPGGSPVSAPPGDADAMSRFFPAEIVHQERSGEFRQVLTVFINLPTVRTEDQLDIFVHSVFNLQDKYGGLFNRVDFGDKGSNLLMFWGAPVSYENDVSRALSFILDLQAKTSIPINAGVTYRIAHAGFVGSPLREEYTCYGRGTNLAARFMTTASRGEIWLDEDAARLAESQFDLEYEGQMTFKGFAEKQKVFVLFEAKEDSETFYDRPMVGRRDELDALADFVEPLWRGQPAGAIIIWGEPGMGKSRLVHEFGQRCAREQAGLLWALCQSDEILRESFNPFRYWLKRYFNQSKAQSELRNKRNFNRKLDGLIVDTDDRSLAAELDRTRSFLGATLDLYWPDSLYAGLDAAGRYENTVLGLLALMKAESLRQPLIVQLEDMHWIDGASRELIIRLASTMNPDSGGPYPIALIATSRHEGPGCPLAEGGRCLEIDLAQLPRESVREMALAMLGGTISEALLELIDARAEGNPFFAEQILRYLDESALLVESAQGWQLKREQQRFLPADVRSVLIARLDRLAQEVKDVVQTAAVLGREFEVALLIRMLGDDQNAWDRIATAEEAAIWSALNQIRYIFKHALLRDTAYQMQVRSRRQALHQLAVKALETLYGQDLRPHYGELAYHNRQAGLEIAAADWYLLAADESTSRGTLVDALSYYNEAEVILPQDETERRWRVLIQQATVLGMQGNPEESKEKALQALALGQALDDDDKVAEAQLYIGNVANIMGDDLAALARLDAALAASRRCGSRRFEALSLAMKTITLTRMGRMEDAAIVAEGALVMAEDLGNERVLVRVLNNLALFHNQVGDYGRAADLLSRQVEINRRRGDQVGLGHGLSNLAYNQLFLGQYEAAKEAIGQALQLALAMGARRLSAYNRLNLSLAEIRLQHPASARQEIESARQVLTEVDDRFGTAVSYTYMGAAFETEGESKQAAAAYESAVRMLREMGATPYAMDALAGSARCALLCDNAVLAIQLASEVWAFLRESGPGGLEFPLLAYESCALAFVNEEDDQAYRAAVAAGYDELMERAQRISDNEWRGSFLRDVPEHKILIERWQKLSSE